MGIVSFGRSATVSTFVTSLALIVLSFTLSEQCIQPVFDRTNSSGTKMENCFQNLSTVIFVEGSIHGQDNVVSGPHGLSPTHLEAGHHGNTMDWPNKRFKILTTVLGWHMFRVVGTTVTGSIVAPRLGIRLTFWRATQ